MSQSLENKFKYKKLKIIDWYPFLAKFVVMGSVGYLAAFFIFAQIIEYINIKFPSLLPSYFFMAFMLPVFSVWRSFIDPSGQSIDKVVAYQDCPSLKFKIEKLLVGIKGRVRVGIYQSDEINAYAVSSLFGKESLIAFSSSLIKKLSDRQIMAIAAHEVAHLKNNDGKNKVWINAFHHMVNLYPKFISDLIKDIILKNKIIRLLILLLIGVSLALVSGGWDPINVAYKIFIVFANPVIFVVALIFLPYFSNKVTDVFFYSYSRHREYIADRDGALMTSVDDMISALRQLTNVPDERESFFDSHPPIEKRISELKSIFN